MRRIVLAILVTVPALAAAAESEDSLRQTVDAYLGSIDTPIPDARWKALGPEAGPLLASIVTGDGLPTRRAGALHGLSIADPARAAPLATTYARSVEEPLVIRSAAVRAVARTLPSSEAVSVLKPLLASPSASLQKRTAEALVGLGTSGCRTLQAHAAPLSGDARAPFSQALARCPATETR
jgi:HEAT repeat protein